MLENHEAPAVEVTHLVKRFPRGQRNAVDDISFSVRRGETFGLLGPNGAGKTTTIGVLTTLVEPTSGSATIAGVDVVADPIGAKQRAPAQRPARRGGISAEIAEVETAFDGDAALHRRLREWYTRGARSPRAAAP